MVKKCTQRKPHEWRPRSHHPNGYDGAARASSVCRYLIAKLIGWLLAFPLAIGLSDLYHLRASLSGVELLIRSAGWCALTAAASTNCRCGDWIRILCWPYWSASTSPTCRCWDWIRILCCPYRGASTRHTCRCWDWIRILCWPYWSASTRPTAPPSLHSFSHPSPSSSSAAVCTNALPSFHSFSHASHHLCAGWWSSCCVWGDVAGGSNCSWQLSDVTESD